MTSESQKKASAKYDKANTVKVTVKLNRKTDEDCITKLEKQPSKAGCIKEAIRAYQN